MQHTIQVTTPGQEPADCLILGIYKIKQDGKAHQDTTKEGTPCQLTMSALQIDQAAAGFLTQILQQEPGFGEVEQSLLLHQVPGIKAKRILLVGLGDELVLSSLNYLKILRSTLVFLSNTPCQTVVSYLLSLPVKSYDAAWKLKQWVLLSGHYAYRFTKFKRAANNHKLNLEHVIHHTDHLADIQSGQQAIKEALAMLEGVNLAKDLANLPANHCTPSYLAEEALALTKRYKQLKTHVLEEKDMQRLKMGALLAVSQGSQQPAKLIVCEYHGTDKSQPQIVLVGKGVTFDSGGLSLKPPSAMDEMKFDMCGAASILGTLMAISQLALPINVVGIIAATENLPSGTAIKPGDVVTTLSGQTVEILNTDAEGRLILCDALSYCQQFNPREVIDIATLTGAVIIALGRQVSGLFSNHLSLAQALLQAANESNDPLWELPLLEEYQSALDSTIADMANVAPDRSAGSIIAACFLARFTKDYHWAHLDIGGTAWVSGKEKGATGRPVPLLVQYLINRSIQAPAG
jgi:leucyl aminopeptidase